MCRAALACCLLCAGAFAQTPIITTVAGEDFVFDGDGKPAKDAPLGFVYGLASDSDGNLYAVDRDNGIVAKIRPDGILEVVAGNGLGLNGLGFYGGDGGPARAAALQGPISVVRDANGNLYISQSEQFQAIRRVSPDGTIETFHTHSAVSIFVSGVDLSIDQAGNVYAAYIRTVERIHPDGSAEVVAGNGAACGVPDPCPPVDGKKATDVPLQCYSVATDPAGNIYLLETFQDRIHRFGSDGILHTLPISVHWPQSLRVGADGSLYVAEAEVISRFDANFTKTVLATDHSPYDLEVTAQGDVYWTNYISGQVKRVRSFAPLQPFGPLPAIEIVAGNGRHRPPVDGLPATSADIGTNAIAIDDQGSIYLADSYSNTVAKITKDGIVHDFAGNGNYSSAGDGGPALAASLAYPSALATDHLGNVYIGELAGNRIRRVSPDGMITTVAGNGGRDSSPDGTLATQAAVAPIEALAVDANGVVYFAEGNYDTVRKIASDGRIQTVAGNGTYGVPADGARAATSPLDGASAIAFDPAGDLYITGSSSVRKVTPAGLIYTVVAPTGNFLNVQLGDEGPALKASVNGAQGLAIDRASNVYIADAGNYRVRLITPDGIIHTYAGTGAKRNTGDGGPAALAGLFANALALDASGNLYIASGHLIRAVTKKAPALAADVKSLNFSGNSAGPPTRPLQINVTGPYAGVPFTASTIYSGKGGWLSVSVDQGFTPRRIDVTADPSTLPPDTYTATIRIQAPEASPALIPITVTFTVGKPLPPVLTVASDALTFTSAGGVAPPAQTVEIANSGGGDLPFAISVESGDGAPWLSYSPQQAILHAGSPLLVAVAAAPGSPAAPGTSTAFLAIHGGDDAVLKRIRVTLLASARDRALLLSQSGMSFAAEVNGGVVPPQSFGVTNLGLGSLGWSVETSTTDGNGWLSVTPAGSTSTAGQAAAVAQIQVNPAGLPAGHYYGLISTVAPDAANSPQNVTISFAVLDHSPGLVLQPKQLAYTAGNQWGQSPGAQTVRIFNPSTQPVGFVSRVTLKDGGDWLAYAPATGVISPDQPLSVVLEPYTVSLKPGGYEALVTFQFTDGTVQELDLTMNVAGPGITLAGAVGPRVTGGVCPPTKLLPTFVSVGRSPVIPAAWPAALEVDVKDDCGNPLTSGSVTVSFSNGDAPLALQSLHNGRWQATWYSASGAANQVTLAVRATDSQGAISGNTGTSTGSDQAEQRPSINTGGVVSFTSAVPNAPLAPGSVISIFGQWMSNHIVSSGDTALPPILDTTSVLVGAYPLPLLYASPTELRGVLPWALEPNTFHSLLVLRDSAYSVPVSVNLAEAQPDVLAAGVTVMREVDGQLAEVPVTADARAHGGEDLGIYATGLGKPAGTIADGATTPVGPAYAPPQPPTVLFGGRGVSGAASLVPGLVAVYRIAVTSPADAAGAVDLQIAIGGQTSPPVKVYFDEPGN